MESKKSASRHFTLCKEGLNPKPCTLLLPQVIPSDEPNGGCACKCFTNARGSRCWVACCICHFKGSISVRLHSQTPPILQALPGNGQVRLIIPCKGKLITHLRPIHIFDRDSGLKKRKDSVVFLLGVSHSLICTDLLLIHRWCEPLLSHFLTDRVDRLSRKQVSISVSWGCPKSFSSPKRINVLPDGVRNTFHLPWCVSHDKSLVCIKWHCERKR